MIQTLDSSLTILLADDDEDDRLMAMEALVEAQAINDIRCVENGEELMDYLLHREKFSGTNDAPSPGLILLDLNMPKKDGREALRDIKTDPRLRHIPVVVMTTSKADDDIMQCYTLGVNSFIVKPLTFEALVATMKTLTHYWFDVVERPPEQHAR